MTAPAALALRKATAADAAAISRFNQAMALETEGKTLIPELVDAGVRRLIATPALGFYVVAVAGDRIVACLLVTQEWSDWRNGLFWWIQSVFVEQGWRRQGVYSSLYRHVQELAGADPGVCGFRLYVEKDNAVAQQAYAALGMAATDYLIYEELRPGVRYFK
ncbi:GNAT family N-acetyltransferase [Caenimonas terrae]|uniref:GNAT family N-acetyltransferase n=1 Tax=Caenimonas terrae TaxID=696074 RepID=A0ABW0NEC7_9BURK